MLLPLPRSLQNVRRDRPHASRRAVAGVAAIALSLGALPASVTPVQAAVTPAILLTDDNFVPACVQADRLTAFVKKRYKALPDRFARVAHFYEKHGSAIGLRWDYAFFQMIVETNWLRFRRPNGRPGDVKADQNNFAGIGATGGGVPGERFATVSDGVLAHLHHIQMYSGKRVSNPKAKRTRKVQDWILPWSRGLGRPVTYTDLTTKWSPTDKGYSDDIESIAKRYRKEFCAPGEWAKRRVPAGGTQVAALSDDTTRSDASAAPSQSGQASRATTQTASLSPATGSAVPCKVFAASFDGAGSSILIRTGDRSQVNYTALAVATGQEALQMQAFIAQHAPGGVAIAQYEGSKAALDRALKLCPQS